MRGRIEPADAISNGFPASPTPPSRAGKQRSHAPHPIFFLPLERKVDSALRRGRMGGGTEPSTMQFVGGFLASPTPTSLTLGHPSLMEGKRIPLALGVRDLTETVVAVAARVLGQVLLVIGLGVIELACLGNLGGDRAEALLIEEGLIAIT